MEKNFCSKSNSRWIASLFGLGIPSGGIGSVGGIWLAAGPDVSYQNIMGSIILGCAFGFGVGLIMSLILMGLNFKIKYWLRASIVFLSLCALLSGVFMYGYFHYLAAV